MKRTRFSVEQIVAVLTPAERGPPVADRIRPLGIAEQTCSRWKPRDAGLELEQVRECKPLQDENPKLTRVVADLSLDNRLQDVLAKQVYGPRGRGVWGRLCAPRMRCVSGAPAEPSAVRGPPTTIGVSAIPALHSVRGAGRWPRRGSGTGIETFGGASIGTGGLWARSSGLVSPEKKA